jgi:hypothetical protein
VKIKNVLPESASFQGYLTEVSFDTSKKPAVIFSKFFGDFMRYIIG